MKVKQLIKSISSAHTHTERHTHINPDRHRAANASNFGRKHSKQTKRK